jgi:hypothetical protein
MAMSLRLTFDGLSLLYNTVSLRPRAYCKHPYSAITLMAKNEDDIINI